MNRRAFLRLLGTSALAGVILRPVGERGSFGPWVAGDNLDAPASEFPGFTQTLVKTEIYGWGKDNPDASLWEVGWSQKIQFGNRVILRALDGSPDIYLDESGPVSADAWARL